MKKNRSVNRMIAFLTVCVLLCGLFLPCTAEADDAGDEYVPVKQDAAKLYKNTGKYLSDSMTQSNTTFGSEWIVIGLARSGRDIPYDYYANICEYIDSNIGENERLARARSSDNAKVILALTALGKDPSDVAGHDLISAFSEMSYVGKQGLNGFSWTLIAMDSLGYEFPEGDVTREAIIEAILEKQHDDGGFSLSSIFPNSDTDTTAMTLQALAPYYEANENVKAAVDRGLSFLSAAQNEYGGFGSVDGASSESCSQVIVALAALGIDIDTDERFVKNGWTAVDALSSYGVSGGGFKHTPSGTRNGLASEQGYYALTAYFRVKEGKTSLYDMSDMEETPSEMSKGDVNGDGMVSADDLTMLSRHVAQIEMLNGAAVLKAADVTGDGQISADDLTVLSRYVAQIIDSFDE